MLNTVVLVRIQYSVAPPLSLVNLKTHLRCCNQPALTPLTFAAEAGLLKDSDGGQHSSYRPVANHWRHAEWLWGIQPEVWLRGRPRVFPRLDAPPLPLMNRVILTPTCWDPTSFTFSPCEAKNKKNLCLLLLPRRSTHARRRRVAPGPVIRALSRGNYSSPL